MFDADRACAKLVELAEDTVKTEVTVAAPLVSAVTPEALITTGADVEEATGGAG